jgi:peptidoglycan/xylan/chitin deacetylase (PgdA/CDA1 family)
MRGKLVAAGCAVWILGFGASPAGARTVVSLTLDDGDADQYALGSILADHSMHATFFVNSGTIDTQGHMTWNQLSDLASGGNEIAGHTVNHVKLRGLDHVDLRHQVCDDRLALIDRGFEPTDFAFPYGSPDAASQAMVRHCGYSSGRRVNGIGCPDFCGIKAELIPPQNPYDTRPPTDIESHTSLATIKRYVTEAENGGGWVQLVFHHICDGCSLYSVSPVTLDAFLGWLGRRAAYGTEVKTVRQVIGARPLSAGFEQALRREAAAAREGAPSTFPWVGVMGALLLAGIGAGLLISRRSRWRRLRQRGY